MKIPRLLFICLLAAILFSCKKLGNSKESDSDPNTATIVANWKLISDSTFTVNTFGNFVKDTSAIYLGIPSDYYDFDASGKLYLNNQNNLGKDTVNYVIASPIQVFMYKTDKRANYAYSPYHVDVLTRHKLVLSGIIANPDFYYGEVLTLGR